MTPTEQDKELREQIHKLFGDGQAYDGGYQSCYDGKWIDMTNEVCAVADFITANYAQNDRVQVGVQDNEIAEILNAHAQEFKAGHLDTVKAAIKQLIAKGLADRLNANYTPNTKLKALIEASEKLNLEFHGRPDCKNCALQEQLSELIKGEEK